MASDVLMPRAPRLSGHACPARPPLTFGNRSLTVHLLRGVAGLAMLLIAVFGCSRFGWPSLLLAPPAVWLLKGCPSCWAAGLFETLAYRAAVRAELRGAPRRARRRPAAKNNLSGAMPACHRLWQ
jgi:hypothetical protein